MKKLITKLILSFSAFLVINLWLIGKGASKGSAKFFISATVEETILFILLQVIVLIIYFIHPLETKKSKLIYWSISELLVLVTILFWGVFIVGPIWFV